MAQPEAEWPLQQNIPILYFFLFHYFLVALADTFSAEPLFLQGDRHLEHLH